MLHVATVGKVTRFLRIGTAGVHANLLHIECGQSPPRQLQQVALPVTGTAGRKRRGGLLIPGQERVTHLVTHLEMSGTDARPDPRDQADSRTQARAQRRDGGFEYARSEAAPAGMGSGHY